MVMAGARGGAIRTAGTPGPVRPVDAPRVHGTAAGSLAAVSGAGGAARGVREHPPRQQGTASKAASSGTVQVVNILPPQLGYAAEYIADMDGFFKKEGLTVKANTARGSAPAIQAILSGTALLSWVGWLESVIDIANKGAPIQSVAFTGRRSTLAIVSDKSKPLELAPGPRRQPHRHPVGGRHQRDDARSDAGVEQHPTDKVPRQVTGFTPGTFELIKKAASPGSSSAPRRRSSSASPSRPRCSCRPTST